MTGTAHSLLALSLGYGLLEGLRAPCPGRLCAWGLWARQAKPVLGLIWEALGAGRWPRGLGGRRSPQMGQFGDRKGYEAYQKKSSVGEAFDWGKNRGRFRKAGYCYKRLEQTLGSSIWPKGLGKGGRHHITRKQRGAGRDHGLGDPTPNQLWKVTSLPLASSSVKCVEFFRPCKIACKWEHCLHLTCLRAPPWFHAAFTTSLPTPIEISNSFMKCSYESTPFIPLELEWCYWFLQEKVIKVKKKKKG